VEPEMNEHAKTRLVPPSQPSLPVSGVEVVGPAVGAGCLVSNWADAGRTAAAVAAVLNRARLESDRDCISLCFKFYHLSPKVLWPHDQVLCLRRAMLNQRMIKPELLD